MALVAAHSVAWTFVRSAHPKIPSLAPARTKVGAGVEAKADRKDYWSGCEIINCCAETLLPTFYGLRPALTLRSNQKSGISGYNAESVQLISQLHKGSVNRFGSFWLQKLHHFDNLWLQISKMVQFLRPRQCWYMATSGSFLYLYLYCYVVSSYRCSGMMHITVICET